MVVVSGLSVTGINRNSRSAGASSSEKVACIVNGRPCHSFHFMPCHAMSCSFPSHLILQSVAMCCPVPAVHAPSCLSLLLAAAGCPSSNLNKTAHSVPQFQAEVPIRKEIQGEENLPCPDDWLSTPQPRVCTRVGRPHARQSTVHYIVPSGSSIKLPRLKYSRRISCRPSTSLQD